MPKPTKGQRTPGSGKPKGYQAPKTIEKELERELLRQQVIANRARMTAAQIENACGVSYMVLRRPDGSYTLATDKKQLEAAVAAGAESFEIFTRVPNTAAYADLMNRALDKPAEQELKIQHDGRLEIVVKKPW